MRNSFGVTSVGRPNSSLIISRNSSVAFEGNTSLPMRSELAPGFFLQTVINLLRGAHNSTVSLFTVVHENVRSSHLIVEQFFTKNMDKFLAERGVFRSRTCEPGYDPLVLLITLLRTVINTKDKCHFESNLEVHIIDQVHYNEALYFEIDESSLRDNLFNEKAFAACFMYSSSFQETLMFLPINLIFKLIKASPSKNTLKDHDNYLHIAPVSSLHNLPCRPYI